MDTRFGIESENFNLFFEKHIPSISQHDKEGLPKDILFKLKNHRLGFLGKLFLLWKCLNKRWWLVVEDHEKGLTPEQFFELKKAIKKKDLGIKKAEWFASHGEFVLASKELADGLDYLNRLSVSPAYNFVQRAKNQPKNLATQREEQLTYICRFLSHYEASKKKWANLNILNIPEWYVLLALYNGEEVVSAKLHKETYRYAFQSSINKIKGTFRTLQEKKYIEKIGIGKGLKLKITPLGKDAVRGILDKYAINC